MRPAAGARVAAASDVVTAPEEEPGKVEVPCVELEHPASSAAVSPMLVAVANDKCI